MTAPARAGVLAGRTVRTRTVSGPRPAGLGGARGGAVAFLASGSFYGAAVMWGGADPDAVAVAKAGAALLATWSFFVAGFVALARRPGSMLGALMLTSGAVGTLNSLTYVNHPVAYAIGNLASPLFILLWLHIAISFPEERGRAGPARRVLLYAGYFVIVPIVTVAQVLVEPAHYGCDTCPPSGVFAAGYVVARPYQLTVIAVFTVTCALVLMALCLRWYRASPPRRHVLLPMLPATVSAFTLAAAGWVGTAVDRPEVATAVLVADFGAYAASALWPVGFLVSLARARLHRSVVADLALSLDAPLRPAQVQQALADALRDPTLRLLLRPPDHERFVDVTGRPAGLPTAAEQHAVTLLEGGAGHVVALVHDPALDEDPRLIRAAATTVLMAIENERLNAKVMAQLAEVQGSRSRIVEAMDAGRRRIERDLHDGAQQRLVNLALMLRLARSRLEDGHRARPVVDEAVSEAEAAIEELRELARGIHPAILTDAGLGPALESLAERARLPVKVLALPGRRLPPTVESAVYFVASEAIANAAKHARANEVTVAVDEEGGLLRLVVSDDGIGGADPHGPGLRGLSDRIAAAGGRLSVTSSLSHGTRITGEIPLTWG
ncbi:sensor histidine kinase [Nonomuraea jiangxiensis]|uniref:histidine kinase n=1 Tax=Nonomuraea jiangxiensis TaxID=633440 RepID=A0A1G8P3V9_9ACTN|nr:sensor histidine kinase [Nonomuraea jiangxiensis]SDI87179.1 Histidine kinase [Nonomuraea jiangxiensis]